MKVTALLPMKGHSERVPNKNMRLFAGKPLYHCVVTILEACDYIKSIIINTDSETIARDTVKNFSKVKIHERPIDLCGDMVETNDLFNYDLKLVDDEFFLQTHSTNPLLTLESLNRAILDFEKSLSSFDSLFSVTKIQSRLYRESGEALNHDPDVLLRTQDLPPLFEENSNIYVFSRDSFVASGNKRIGLNPKMFIMDKLEAMDIDDEEDFILAEQLYKMRNI
jgi:CMP-N-acetylneuraminic acid synthetase